MVLLLRRLIAVSMLALPLVCISISTQAKISKSTAASAAKAQHGGKVLSVTLISSQDGLTTYKVKLLLEGGRVKTVTISG